MSENISVRIAGKPVVVEPGTSVAVAIFIAGAASRFSVSGQARVPFCGMGICFECRVTINGIPHCRSCQITCETGMEIAPNE